jgi:hypothetical protein
MSDAYRPVGQYVSNLKRFLDMVRNKTGFEIRIYTDDSGKEHVLKLAGPDVSVYHYNYDPLREKVGHIGTFGTLVRFLPLFEDLEMVWITDIDVVDMDLPTFDTPIFYNEMVCYERKVYGRKHTIVADKIISRVSFPISMLTGFINKLAGNMKSDIDALNLSNKYKPKSSVPYGIDELFLNTSIYNYLKRHRMSVTTSKNYLLNSGFYKKADLSASDEQFVNSYYRNPNRESFRRLKDLYNKKILPLVPEHSCLEELFEVLDELPYTMKKVQTFSYSFM